MLQLRRHILEPCLIWMQKNMLYACFNVNTIYRNKRYFIFFISVYCQRLIIRKCEVVVFQGSDCTRVFVVLVCFFAGQHDSNRNWSCNLWMLLSSWRKESSGLWGRILQKLDRQGFKYVKYVMWFPSPTKWL